MAWEIEESEDGAKVVVHLDGVVDSTNVEEFFALVNSLFKRKVYRIVLDMGNTSYISSGGLSVIVDAYRKAEKAGGKLAIARASEMVCDLFEVVQIGKILPFYPTVDEALREV